MENVSQSVEMVILLVASTIFALNATLHAILVKPILQHVLVVSKIPQLTNILHQIILALPIVPTVFMQMLVTSVKAVIVYALHVSRTQLIVRPVQPQLF